MTEITATTYSTFSSPGKRNHNEDYVYPQDGKSGAQTSNIFIVTDGNGGYGKGDIAAQICTDLFVRFFAENQGKEPVTQSLMNQALKYVENGIDEYVREHPECWGMGATVALVYLDGSGAHVGWVGNCRFYHFRAGQLLYKTLDHTEAAQLLQEGKISEQEAATSPRRFPLRTIQGSSYPTAIDYRFIPAAELATKDILYLCSDGVLESVNDRALSTITTHGDNLVSMSKEIEDLCRINSGDNYTSCLVGLEAAGTTNSPASKENEPVAMTVAPETPPANPVVVEEPSFEPAFESKPEEEFTALPSIEVDSPLPNEEEMPMEVTFDLPEITPEPQPENINPTPVIEPLAPIVPPPAMGETPRPKRLIDDLIDEKQEQKPRTEAETNKSRLLPPEPTEKAGSGWQLPVVILGLTLLLAVILVSLWWSNKSKGGGKSYDEYMEMATAHTNNRVYDSAIIYCQKAVQSAGDDANKIREANLRMNELQDLLRQQNKEAALVQAASLAKEGSYVSLIQARRMYEDVIRSYSDNGGAVQGKIDSLTAAMNKIKPETAYEQLLAGATNMCKEGNGAEAEMYIAEARKLRVSSDKLKELSELSSKCAKLAEAAATTGGDAVADADNRSTGTDSSQPGAGDKADKKTAQNPNQAAGTTTPGNSSKQVVDGSAKGKTNAPALPTNWEKMTPLEKGKVAFKQKMYAKSAEYLEAAKSQKPLDGEAAYMLAYQYHSGSGVNKNADKAKQLAKQSANAEYPSGLYLHAKILLSNKNKGDSIIAKGQLQQAANLKQPDASNLLKSLK